ncbi:zf-C2H2_6 domain-containing protein, partial [Cephalotus follicularis]
KEYQEFKYVCKFCYKSFPCGRSLGGHMRSHLTYNNNSTDSIDDKKAIKKKPVSSIKCGGTNNSTSEGQDTSLYDKFCEECGKCFQSWKALFGHMKCHSSEKERVCNNNSLEDQGSLMTNSVQKLVMDSQSDDETSVPNQRRRSKRRPIRYMVAPANSCSFHFGSNSGPSSVSENDQEKKEAAMCLMLLSRHVGCHWRGSNSVADSFDNNSVSLGAKIEIKSSACNGDETVKLKEVKEKKLESAVTLNSEMIKHEVSINGLYKNDKINEEYRISDSLKKLKTDDFDNKFCKDLHKRNIYECTTCNKVFHSYQALGGHRASHSKFKGCFASRMDSSETSIETGTSSDPTSDSNLITSINNGIPNIIGQLLADCGDDKADSKSKAHECPICLKVYPSGQALGGHKRSHLVVANEARNNQTIVIEKPIPAIREFLDLNLPAPVEEETNGLVGFKPWWMGISSHKHKALVGLISN